MEKTKTNQKNAQSKIVIYIFCLKTPEYKKNKMFMKYVYQPQTYCIARHFNCSIA